MKLEGKIIAMLKKDPDLALELAVHGRPLSKIERMTDKLLIALKYCADDPQRILTFSKDLSDAMLNAVVTRNTQALLEIARFAKEWDAKKIEKETYAGILATSIALNKCQGKMPVQIVAKLLGQVQSAVDGNSSLRKICRKLKFPLAKDRRGPKSFGKDKLTRIRNRS